MILGVLAATEIFLGLIGAWLVEAIGVSLVLFAAVLQQHTNGNPSIVSCCLEKRQLKGSTPAVTPPFPFPFHNEVLPIEIFSKWYDYRLDDFCSVR
ncbi:hypothetical protein F4780DRAFT_740165 [Xylariomycetidae sp. FL0641]|nr:hypothetical protein F4780DRAFT_740165 [Xylariomycetidae sp. FL0641]